MKKYLAVLLTLALLAGALVLPAQAVSPAWTLTVNGKAMDLSALPAPVREENGTVMIPLRLTAEALGLTVTWLPEEKAARVEDSVQSALIRFGSADVAWTGKLKVINLSRDTAMDAPAAVVRGVTYVPARLFEEYFCTVSIGSGTVDVEPIVYTVDQTG